MTDHGRLKRLRVALEANGMDTSGSTQQCLDRLLCSTSSTQKRKHTTPAYTEALRKAILGNVQTKLKTLPLHLLIDMSNAFGIETAHMHPFGHTVVHMTEEARRLKIAEHLVDDDVPPERPMPPIPSLKRPTSSRDFHAPKTAAEMTTAEIMAAEVLD